MDYDRRRTRWPVVFFYLVYVCVVVYLLFTNNHYLYSHKELRVALAGQQLESVTPVPRRAGAGTPGGDGGAGESLGPATYWNQGTPERTSHDATGTTRDKDYVAEWTKVIVEAGGAGEVRSWAADESGVYVTGSGPWAFAFNPEGDVKWKFRFIPQEPERGLLDPVTDGKAVYLSRPRGQLAALDKADGRLRWKLALAEEILTAPVIMGNELWLIVKPLETERRRLEDAAAAAAPERKDSRKPPPNLPQHRFARVNRATGELIGYSDAFATKDPTFVSWAKDENFLVFTADNKMTIMGSDDGKVVNAQTLPDSIKGPAVIAEGKIFLALTSGKVQAWELSKKGKFEWEIDLSATPASAPTYIPAYQRLAVLTSDGHFHIIDIKKPEHLWRFNLENHNPSQEIFAARLGGRHIENLQMKWEKKGWTAWAPCSDNRLCIYNPDKGQLISRVPSTGGVASGPLFVGKHFYLISHEKSGENHKYRLIHYLDDDTFKKKEKAAAEAAASSHPETNGPAKDGSSI
jgi:outer membrane protein assembly factor BamB